MSKQKIKSGETCIEFFIIISLAQCSIDILESIKYICIRLDTILNFIGNFNSLQYEVHTCSETVYFAI